MHPSDENDMPELYLITAISIWKSVHWRKAGVKCDEVPTALGAIDAHLVAGGGSWVFTSLAMQAAMTAGERPLLAACGP